MSLPIGAAIRARRLNLDMTVAEVSRRSGLDRTGIDKIERGTGVTLGGPTATLERLAAALRTTPARLVRAAEKIEEERG